MGNYEFIKYRRKYKQEVIKLVEECFSNISASKVNSNTYIAVCNNEVVGNISYQIIEDSYKGNIAYISYVCTKKEYRNRGIAHKLLEIVENNLKEKNIHRIMLTSSYEKKDANKLYLNCGYLKKESNIFVKDI